MQQVLAIQFSQPNYFFSILEQFKTTAALFYLTGDIRDNENDGFDCCSVLMIAFSYILVFVSFPLSLCFCIKVIKEFERAVILRLGRITTGGARGPGLFFILPCIDTIIVTDLRTVTYDVRFACLLGIFLLSAFLSNFSDCYGNKKVNPQEILTKDSVTVTVDAVMYYRVSNPTLSVINVENVTNSTGQLAATTLRNILGTKTLQEILQDREHIAHLMQVS